MNKEVHYEGWLIKSPPTKRIWRARWRRRWFTLKQGEIPEQFCLEYYTDRNCRKLKGVIDLDQCEQVDCGLRLENRKQKFQFMFDIKTPKRTYYLAADTEADMRDWVNCICQVCHLLDTKQSGELLQDQNRLQNATNATSATVAGGLPTNANSFASISTISSTSMRQQSTFGNNDIQMRRPIVFEQPQSSNSNSSHNHHISHQQQQQQNNVINNNNNNNNNNSLDCSYVNAEYSNRETLLCDIHFDQQQLATAAAKFHTPTSSSTLTKFEQQQQTTPGAAIYLNSPLFGAKQHQQQQQPQQQLPQKQQQQQNDGQTQQIRLAVNANGVVRKIPENLVLSNVSLADTIQQQQQQTHQQQQQQPQTTQHAQQHAQQQQQQQYNVQPSPALSTASGPYIPISECFSGSPKLTPDSNNPTTPLNNLDPKFYDTPRSHNNIGLNLTNDQSYSPKITNCSLPLQQQQSLNTSAANKSRSHRSDSDSESVFTDDEEWAHPLPLRENVDRSTRPSDSSVENESFVLTYSQRFSKVPDNSSNNGSNGKQKSPNQNKGASTASTKDAAAAAAVTADCELKMLKNRKNLILDIKEHEKIPRELPPQLSDTENTSPAIGPRDASSVVEESYDIPRSHNLPYYNMGQLFEKSMQVGGDNQSPETNPMAASTPNLLQRSQTEIGASVGGGVANATGTQSAHVRTLPRPHCYTNAAPTKVEGNVFRYDFVEQGDLPPVNRKLKPKSNLEDKPPEEVPAKPPIQSNNTTISTTTTTNVVNAQTPNTPSIYDNLANKFLASMNMLSLKNATTSTTIAATTTTTAAASNNSSINIAAAATAEQSIISSASATATAKPPSIDRKLKPNAYKTSNVNPRSRLTSSSSLNRASNAPLSMVLTNDNESYVMETRTLPRQPRNHFNYDNTSNDQQQSQQQHHLHHHSHQAHQHHHQQYHHQHTSSLGGGCSSSTLALSGATAVFGKDSPHTLSTTTTTATAFLTASSQQNLQKSPSQILQLPMKNEHKLQYFDLDVANPPQINRQSMSVGNLNAPGIANRANMSSDPSVRAPAKSGVVYNYVDFVKTEAFKRIREERKKESEGGGGNNTSGGSCNGGANNPGGSSGGGGGNSSTNAGNLSSNNK